MESFIDESHKQIKEFFLDLHSRFKEAAELCSRQYEKKIKQQDDELRLLKEKLTKKDEILKFHEEEINALRNQVKSLKTERPLCPSCSHREEVQDPKSVGRKRIFSPDSSCGQSVDGNSVTDIVKVKPRAENFSQKRRRTDPLAETVTPQTAEPMDKAFLLDKTPERVRKHFLDNNETENFKAEKIHKTPAEAADSNAVFHVNDLSPASVKSVGPETYAPKVGPELGESLLFSQRDSVTEESPPLIPLRAAARASSFRRPSAERLGTRSSRNARQMKLHTLTFAQKRDLSIVMQDKKKTATNLQDLEETVLEPSAPKMETRQVQKGSVVKDDKDLPFVGSSPSEAKLFKKPNLPRIPPPRKTEETPLDPIACSTLKLSDFNTSQPDSVVFGASSPERRPLSPRNVQTVSAPAVDKEKDDEKQKQFKFAGDVERRKNERRNLAGFSCYECYEYYRGSNLTDEEINEKIRQCSRHRAKHAPPSTPEGFWDVDLPSTPVNVTPIEVQRKRRRKPFQFPKKP